MAKTKQDQTLAQGLATAALYKRNQGKLVRQLTFVAIAGIFILAAWSLSGALTEFPNWLKDRGVALPRAVAQYSIPMLVTLLGAWFAFRVVNYPRFADFLISVQAEMDKVSWASTDELKRATVVVIVTMFFLALALFAYDVFWYWLFRMLTILQPEAPDADA
jgi:preprotein translocase subunit SecE